MALYGFDPLAKMSERQLWLLKDAEEKIAANPNNTAAEVIALALLLKAAREHGLGKGLEEDAG